MEITCQQTGWGAALAPPSYVCQTESRRSGSYDISRFNACTWQLRREDIMICLGPKCRYRFCQLEDAQLPPVGSLCPWEYWYAGKLSRSFQRDFPRGGIGQYLEDYEALHDEYVVALLLANRVAVRLSRAMEECCDAVENRGNMPVDKKPFGHIDLAFRYMTASHNRVQAIYSRLPDLNEKLRNDQHERRILRLMAAHGYYSQALEGGPIPAAKDAPEWILRQASTQ